MARTKQPKRGEIWYYIGEHTGRPGEEQGVRPAVVVSNDICNRTGNQVALVPLTTQTKKPLPTHAKVSSSGKLSTALAEQVTTVSKERLLDCIGRVNSRELKEVEQALRVQLALTF